MFGDLSRFLQFNANLFSCLVGILFIMAAALEFIGIVLAMPLVAASLEKTEVAYLIPIYPYLCYGFASFKLALGGGIIGRAMRAEMKKEVVI